MSKVIAIVGLGEMGAAFAHGWLRCGFTIVPVRRGDDPARLHTDPEMMLVAVGEGDLSAVLDTIPERYADRVGLLQNELLPLDWARHRIENPTVASVWFEKKRGKALNVVLPTVVAGPHARLFVDALAALDLPVEEVPDDRLLFELVTKNLYILTANIAGLEVGGVVSDLWNQHRQLATDVAREVLAIQAWRADAELPEAELIAAMVRAFEGDPEHGCTGRSAPVRLNRALAHAREAGLDVPTLKRLAEHLPPSAR